MIVYELLLRWFDDGFSGFKSELYASKEKAIAEFNKAIEEQKTAYARAFDENGELRQDWCIDEGVGFWLLYQDGLYGEDSVEITVTTKEVL